MRVLEILGGYWEIRLIQSIKYITSFPQKNPHNKRAEGIQNVTQSVCLQIITFPHDFYS